MIEDAPARSDDSAARACASAGVGIEALGPTALGLEPPRRLHIIGGPGSGKTTVSRQLANQWGVPVYDLDEIAQAGPAPAFRIGRCLDERVAELRRIASQPEWVTEGSFLWWTEELLQAADVILWLDLPPPVAFWRVTMRDVVVGCGRAYLADIARQGNTLPQVLRALRHPHIRPALTFLRYTWSYYSRPSRITPPSRDDLDDGWALTRADTARWLEAYQDNLIHCTRAADVTAMVRVLTALRGKYL